MSCICRQALQASYDTLQDEMDSLTAQDKVLQSEVTRAGEQLSQTKQELCETREAREAAEARLKVRAALVQRDTSANCSTSFNLFKMFNLLSDVAGWPMIKCGGHVIQVSVEGC